MNADDKVTRCSWEEAAAASRRDGGEMEAMARQLASLTWLAARAVVTVTATGDWRAPRLAAARD